jgi:hypothetical protein
MKFTVFWTDSAEAELAAIWTKATDRTAVTRAAKQIDDQLAIDPMNAGESRDGDERVVFEPPLGVLAEVREADCLVKVLHVRKLPNRPS